MVVNRLEAIHTATPRQRGGVLIHCKRGQYRSAALMALWLILFEEIRALHDHADA